MLAGIRVFAKSWVAKGLLSVLVLCFVLWGVGGSLRNRMISDAVITAGSRQITSADYRRVFENYKQEAEQQTGQQISDQDAVAQGLDSRVLDDVALSESFSEYITRTGVRPGGQLVADALRKQPAFFNPITGQFDKQAYAAKLAQAQLTPERFESLLRDEIAQEQFASGVAAGLKAPRLYGALVAGYELESRQISYLVVTPDMVAPPKPPTDAQLLAFMNQNAAQLKRPEMRVLTVARLSAKALAQTLPADPAAVEKLFDFRKDTLSTPEKRSFVEIPAPDLASAQAMAARLKAGQSPDAVAKAFGRQPIVYKDTPKAAVADPQVAGAAFAAPQGQVMGPVQGLLGYAVFEVSSITPAQAATLDSVRPQLEAQVRADAATQKVYDQAQKFDDAHSGGASLADSAKAAGVTLLSIGPVTAQGLDTTGKPIDGLSPKLLKDAFAQTQGGETDMVQDGEGEYYAVRVEKVIAPALPALSEIKEPLTRYFMGQQVATELTAKAEAIADAIRKGQSLEAAAAALHTQIGHAPAVTRASLQQNQALSPDLDQKIFAAKAGDVVTGLTAKLAAMVARVEAVKPAPVDVGAQLVAAQNSQLSIQAFNDIGELAKQAARAEIKPKVDESRAKQALGVSTDSSSGGSKAP